MEGGRYLDTARTQPTVLFACRSLPWYRVAFFDRLRRELDDREIDLSVLYGQPARSETSKNGWGELDWAIPLRNRVISAGRKDLIWQPCLRRGASADLVVVEQAARLLVNYPLFAMQALGLARVAFWGHGANLNSHTKNAAGEWAKRQLSRRSHWWFAYTEETKARVEALGYPTERITVVQNAVDTVGLRTAVATVRVEDRAAFRTEHRLGKGPVGLYVGSLYHGKRLGFLFQSAELIAKAMPTFRLVVVGDGPDRAEVERAATQHTWLRYLGSDLGPTKVLALASARVMLLPGLVGLAILEAFAAGLPVVTAAGDHGPEIEYLHDGENGILVPNSESAAEYAAAAQALLSDDDRRERMVDAAKETAATCTIDAMVARFTTGLEMALAKRGPE